MSFRPRPLAWPLGALVAFLLALPAEPASADPGDVEVALQSHCTSLEQTDFSTVQDAPADVLHARQVPSTQDIPAQCWVSGYVVPQVEFELRLPSAATWNGKLLFVGNFGWGMGVNSQFCDAYVQRGYACLASNTGHAGAGKDGLWAANNLQAQVDFAYRAVHVATLAGKAISTRYYARDPRRSYFVGCSTGGYQGLMEAQRFPWDFDGIIAGAPDIDEAHLTMRELWSSRSLLDAHGRPVLSSENIKLLHRAALSQCDRDDGLVDGIIGDPLSCHFDPATLACKSRTSSECLTQPQIEAARRIYAGPPEPHETTIFSTHGVLPGSELGWDILGEIGTSQAESFFRYMIYGASPEWTQANYDFKRDYKRLGMGALYADTNPDLRKFKAAGGKLLVYQGWDDVVERPAEVVDYYAMVGRVMGGPQPTHDFFRLFMVPGMNHCSGGSGAYTVDYLGYLDTWVEHNKAPEWLMGSHISESYLATHPEGPLFNVSFNENSTPAAPVTFTRPIYPYPQYARYTGVGDPNDAKNFEPSEREAGLNSQSGAADAAGR